MKEMNIFEGTPVLPVRVGWFRSQKKFSLSHWLRFFPLDKLEFGRIDNTEYFSGLQKFLQTKQG